MPDHRVIQQVHSVLAARIQAVCDGLDLGWIGVQRALGADPRPDEDSTIYCSLYRCADVAELASVRVQERASERPGPDGRTTVQAPPRFLHLYFIVTVEGEDVDRNEILFGAILQALHEQPTLLYRPVRPSATGPGAAGPEVPEPAQERASVALVDDLPFGDACFLLRAYDRALGPYLCCRVFVRIDQPMSWAPAVRRVEQRVVERAGE